MLSVMLTYLQQCYAAPNQGDTQHKRWTGEVNIDHCKGRQRMPAHAARPPAVCCGLCDAAKASADGTAWLQQAVCPAAVATTSQDSAAHHFAVLQSADVL
jgi:hypothetical protein